MIKKYWHARTRWNTVPGLIAGWVVCLTVAALLGHPWPLHKAIIYPVGCTLGGLCSVALMCRPAGPWVRYWIEEGTAHQEHLLTRKARHMPLSAPFVYQQVGWHDIWLILAEEPVDSVKAARKLYRQGKALFLPVDGLLAADETLAQTLKQAKKMD